MNIKAKKDPELTYDAAIVNLNSVSTPAQRKEILFELCRLTYADNVIQPREEQMVKFAMDVFKVPVADYQKIVALVKDLAKVYRDIKAYIGK